MLGSEVSGRSLCFPGTNIVLLNQTYRGCLLVRLCLSTRSSHHWAGDGGLNILVHKIELMIWMLLPWAVLEIVKYHRVVDTGFLCWAFKLISWLSKSMHLIWTLPKSDIYLNGIIQWPKGNIMKKERSNGKEYSISWRTRADGIRISRQLHF